jgi:hypothetical protein
LIPQSYPAPAGAAAAAAMAGGARLALDNLIRRELKVGDPNDASQVAQALMSRYRDDPRARSMAQEAQGLPAMPLPAAPVATPQAGATSLDLAQATADVEMDLRELTTNNLAKDIIPELEGWAQAIRSAIQQGISVAQFGTDTRSRDMAFAMRRQLGDYARVARLVGALTPPLNAAYRNLAQSLDEVSSVILVMMGEALANTGMAGGRYLLQTPFTELQVRRDVVLNALRNLMGATQEAFGPNDWSRGIDAYRQLFQKFEAQGHGELRALLVETELARSMDELIHLAGNGAPTGLRALGVTAWAQLNRFIRFVQFTIDAVTPPSPPLAAFQDALQMFIDGFEPAGGFRLLRIARPPVLFYGLYGSDEISNADRRLLQLVINRGTIAGQLDCLTRCNCDPLSVKTQIVGDMLLYDIDRAIDLYCMGDDDLGMHEFRASAYSYVIETAKANATYAAHFGDQLPGLFYISAGLLRPIGGHPFFGLWDTPILDYDRERLGEAGSVLVKEIGLQQVADQELKRIVEQMTTNCMSLTEVFTDVLGSLSKAALQSATGKENITFTLATLRIPANLEDSFDRSFGDPNSPWDPQ